MLQQSFSKYAAWSWNVTPGVKIKDNYSINLLPSSSEGLPNLFFRNRGMLQRHQSFGIERAKSPQEMAGNFASGVRKRGILVIKFSTDS